MRQRFERIVSNLRPLQAEVDDQWDQNLSNKHRCKGIQALDPRYI